MNKANEILVTKSTTLRDALACLDKTALSVLLLVNEDGSFLRTITDGDIRRLLLAGSTLESDLSALPEHESVVVKETLTDDQLLVLMNQHHISQIPQLDEYNKPVGLHLRHKLKTRVQLSIPHMGEHELAYVREAFDTNWIAPLGPNVDAFEKEIAEYVGAKHAAAVSSGTAAIHLSLCLLGVGAGDVVICSSFTFIASANPIMYQGATPVFVDSDPETWNMSPQALERAIESCIAQGKKPKAIIAVHLYGQSANMAAIMAIANRYEIAVVEDAAESLGGLYQGQHTGTFGKFGVFSFNGNKIITTSGGGMLVSDDKALIEKARFLSTQARDPAPYYLHTHVGYNYRMSNVLAGIGRGQLKVLDDRVAARRAVFDHYSEALMDFDCLEWMPEPTGDFSNRWLTTVRLKNNAKLNAAELIAVLAAENIEARHLWKPMHQQPLFAQTQYFSHEEGYSVCDELFDAGLCLPSGSNMEREHQDRVIDVLKQTLNV